MTDLLTLIKKLLKQVPSRINSLNIEGNDTVDYFYNNMVYSISYYQQINGTYCITLTVSTNNPFYFLNQFQIEVSEKDYMEIKWKTEEWEKYLKERQLNQFEEFVDSFSDNPMDSLLNE